MAEQIVFGGKGIIQEKLEKISKKDKPYWSYKITIDEDDPETIKTFNFFDYEAGSKVKTGDRVQVYWHENQADRGFGDQLFRNIKSIFPVELADDQIYEATHSTETDNARSQGGGASSVHSEGPRTGMLFNNAVQLCIAENKTKNEDIESRFISLKNLMDKLENPK